MGPLSRRAPLAAALLLGGLVLPAGAGLAQPTPGAPALIATRSISAEAALVIAREAMQAARQRRCEEAVAVLDQGGTLLVLLRSDSASQQFVEGASQKAWTALNLRASTRDVLATIQKGDQDDGQLPFIPKALFLMGGVPLTAGDAVVGAVGTAGCVNGVDDDAVAQQAARVFQRLINR
ncbi:MAG: heme-binding protein [Cyanobacteriota bacterium]|nr:heme-binding protein [Cyanobacteriota bacterium]